MSPRARYELQIRRAFFWGVYMPWTVLGVIIVAAFWWGGAA